ncbi:TIGR03862 family flavoprotein [Sulfitobacter sp. F26204]|uniref:TIGR03862 family flavoprotein n=1 Tax=Sulfitobacter sp. F26204 TaxID=2996014 RepID=UPI00225E0456|nr:TIGR03862 family flavoprotein [Sulfitobacter sp. F26204]MCX7558021.1 TIGR03862 family flavoprotein [Sulfitobacter sp. F26204]
MTRAVVVGAGPAGLMAAEVMAQAGLQVTLCEGKPSVGRKFLMAGKSGLNLTKDEPEVPFLEAFSQARSRLTPMIRAFDSKAVQDWARGMEQEIFTGTTSRVFPTAMKASPLLRAWLGRLVGLGVELRTGWLWQGWQDGSLAFQTSEGMQTLATDATVLALGGSSWSRLGSTGKWAEILAAKGVAIAPFEPANAGIEIAWSDHMAKHYGSPIKGVAWQAGPYGSRGEATLSATGLEGGGIYAVSRGVREGHVLTVDLLPDLTVPEITKRLQAPRGKASLSNHLRKTLRLTPAQIALAQEMARPLPDKLRATAWLLKALPVTNSGLRPLDEAISTAGGIPFAAMNEGLMLHDLPGVFAAGEMLDWEAPTGGYLISACLATGRWAGQHAAEWALKA